MGIVQELDVADGGVPRKADARVFDTLPTPVLPHNCATVLGLAVTLIDELIVATAVGAGVGTGVTGVGVVGH